MKAKLFNVLFVVSLLLILAVPVTQAAPAAQGTDRGPIFKSSSDDAPHPLGVKQRAARQVAFQAQLLGLANGPIYDVGHGKYVELERVGEDTIWTILAEFGDLIDPVTGGTPGPVHNQIPRPDRSVDNTTIWARDFNKAYFEKLLFSEQPRAISMRNYYIEQSSNRYTVNGIVEDWALVPYNEAFYGSNLCGSIVCSFVWDFVQHGANAWYESQIAAGMSPAEIDAYLSQLDVWDRYDWDGDGNFDEPDGYIDHFQIVHAGEGEETGGGAQGEDAIWSHRWYAFFNLIGIVGPSPEYLLGGVQIGESAYWIGDYTVEPENGGVGVFAHEFGHDLGLPDLYDTSGNTGGAENSTGFWTLYSSGSYGNSGRPRDGIGTKPTHMSALEKLFLNWSNFAAVNFGDDTGLTLGPAEFNTIDAQQLVVLLPDKQVDFNVGTPFSGSFFYHSGSGNNIDSTMTRSVTLPAGTVTLNAKVNYEIETDWDYAYLTVNGTNVHTNLSTNEDPNGQNFGEGITGSSDGNWVDLTADLSDYAGQTVELGFRYWTDVAVIGAGFNIDDIAITGLPLDDAETDPGWTYDGFIRTTGVVTRSFFNAYIGEFRQYEGYDKSLKTGPYNFGFLDDPDRQNWVEHFRYQDGLLVWYYDESFDDNNVGDHCLAGRCGGLFLPVDAHPELLIRPDGQVWRPRIQSFDSTFTRQTTDRLCLHFNSEEQCYPRLKGNPLFDDRESYWIPPDPSIGHFGWSSVPLPGFGVKIQILGVHGSNHDSRDGRGRWMDLQVTFEE
jgi:immune inhibitor A